jgi:hypothetical protein
METDILRRLLSSIFSEIKFEGKSPSFYYPELVGDVFEGWIMLLPTSKFPGSQFHVPECARAYYAGK